MIRPKRHVRNYGKGRRATEPRIGKVVRLGRNERTFPFPDAVVREMFSGICGEDLVAIPELEPFYAQVVEYLGVERDELTHAVQQRLRCVEPQEPGDACEHRR